MDDHGDIDPLEHHLIQDYYELFYCNNSGQNDININFARLLYHELAHANDFLPAETHSSLNISLKVYEAINSIEQSSGFRNVAFTRNLRQRAHSLMQFVRFQNFQVRNGSERIL